MNKIQRKNFWEDRTIKRLTKGEKIGNSAIGNIIDIYDEAKKNIQKEIELVYTNYAKKGILTRQDLTRALIPHEKEIFMQKLTAKAKLLKIDITKVYDERYLYRISRLDSLHELIKLEALKIAPQEQKVSQEAYQRIINEGYKGTQADLEAVGVKTAFSSINRNDSTSILNSRFMGKDFSTRIWGNATDRDSLASRLPSLIGSKMISGQSIPKVTRMLRDEFNVKTWEATRLIRTQTNYFQNQAELQSYIDDGIEYYQWLAVMDNRTSEICKAFEFAKNKGEKFKTTEAEAGVNYPPMHPNCRSTTTIVFEDISNSPETMKLRINAGLGGNEVWSNFVNNVGSNENGLQTKVPIDILNRVKRVPLAEQGEKVYYRDVNNVIGNEEELAKWKGKDEVLELFHGTKSENDKNIDKFGLVSGTTNYYGKGVYTTTDESLAKAYGDSTYKIYVKTKNIKIQDAINNIDEYVNYGDRSAEIMEKGERPATTGFNDIVLELMEKDGYGGVKTHLRGGIGNSDVYVLFDKTEKFILKHGKK